MAARALLVLVAALLVAAPTAQAAVDRDAAAKKALAALGTETNDDPVIVFGLRSKLRPRTIVTQAGPSGGAVAARNLRTSFHRARSRRIGRAGATTRRADVLLRTGRERSWFFFEDKGPNQAFEHPGRVVVVGAKTGTVRIASTEWVPLVNGRLPAFFAGPAGYESPRYRILSRHWAGPAAPTRARTRQAAASEPHQQVADALAAEKSCALRISDTLGDFFDFGRVDLARARLGNFFEGLEKLNAGFISRRYTTKAGDSPIDAAQELIDDAGCRDLFLYVAGAAPRTGAPGIVIGMRPARGGLLEWHVLTADQLEGLVKRNAGVTFKFLFDAPYTTRVNPQLIDEPNTVLLLSSSGPNDASFTFLPGVSASPNPEQLLEFTNAILSGIQAFIASPHEMAQWQAARANGGPSMMSWMLARALTMSPAWMFAAPIETLKLPTLPKAPEPPPSVAAAPNRAPRGTTPAQPTDEDTPKSFTLTATDPDGDALTFTITDQPDHGTLTGTAPDLTYTPNQDFDGTDSFTYQVSDGRGGTDTQTVQIPVKPDNDAAAVTTTSGGSAAYTENAAGVAIDPNLTVSDPDSTQLTGAVVRIASGYQGGDQLEFTDQNGITGTYNAGTGVLTLDGDASIANYQAALRSVKFSSGQDDPTASRTIEFTAEDGDEAGAPASRGVTITPVNDAPVASASPGDRSYEENAAPVAIDPLFTLGDEDDTNIESAQVRISSGFESGDLLGIADPQGLTANTDPGTGVLTLSGTASVATYQSVLRSVTFASNADNPATTKTIEFKANDGSLDSNLTTKDISITRVNDAPVVTTTSGDTAYTEGGSGTVVDGGLALTEVDDTNLESAQVRISNNFSPGDSLVFVNQSGISGVYNSGTGVLTLSGSASRSDYQAALRSIEFSNTSNDNITTPKTVEFQVNDGDANSNAATKDVVVTGVNDASTVTTSSGSKSYAEGDGEEPVDDGITVSDPDSPNLSGATVQITANFTQAEDDLTFADTAAITGSYNDATGTLTLSGSDTVANYQAALRSVKYVNTSDNPSTATRTVSFQVDDGGSVDNLSNVATRDISGFGGTNDAPVVNTSAGSTSYSEGDPATAVDGALTVSDIDDTSLEGGQVRISAGFETGDELVFVDQNGITGTYASGTGVLTLSGTASLSDYQTALRSVSYRHTGSDNPSPGKTVEFTVDDGDADSAPATKSINLTGVNDPPVLNTTGSTLSYTEGDGAVAVDSGITATDPDSANLVGATVQITSNFSSAQDDLVFVDTPNINGSYDDSTGTLTLSGSDTVANYQAALRSVRYQNTSDNPSTATRTVAFRVDDGAAVDNLSNVATRDISVSPANDAPVVNTSGGATSYTEGDSGVTVDGALTLSDADDTNLESAQVRISSGFEAGDDLTFVNTANITGGYNTGTGVLTLTGTDTVANYQAALRSITFDNTSDDDLASPKTIEFKVNDGDTDSNAATKDVAVTPVNDAPTVTTTSAALSYTEGAGPVAVDTALAVSDPDSTSLSGATVQITSNHVQADDQLAFSNQNGISGSYDDASGTLTLSGAASLADYQTALRSVTYENVDDNPSGSKTVSFQVDDGGAVNDLSNVATRDINLGGVNDAPVVTTSAGNTAYTEGDPATTIDGALTLSDADDTNLEGGQVRISNNFQSGDDLVFVDQNGISGNYNAGTGVLTLTGTASKADYQTALRSIQFQTTNDDPSASKTVEFKVNDGDVDSNAATKGIAVTAVNDAPTLTTSAGSLSYTEGDGPQFVDPGLTATDPDSTQFQGATVQITGNHVQADDELAFVNTANITGSYNDSTGTLTLSGTDTVANYQAALRTVTYSNTSQDPSGTKTVSFQATDAQGAASNVATRNVNLTGVNDAPVVDTSAGSTPYTEGGLPTAVDSALTVSDADDANLEGGQVRIATNFEAGDALVFVSTPTITGVYNPATGVLTLSGTDSVADYQAALRSVQYQHVGDNPAGSKTIEFKVNDGDADSNAPTKGLNVTGVNDGPSMNTSAGSASFVEDTSGGVAVDPNLSLSDPDSSQIQGATVSITSNFDSAEDELEFIDTATITGTYNSGTGVLTLSGTDTVANYQSALRSVKYDNTDTVGPNTATRTVSFQATDAEGAASNVATRDVTVAQTNDPPFVVTTTGGDTGYTEGGSAVTVDGGVDVTDPEDTNIEGGQVRISSGFQSGDDLVFVNQNGISGTYNSGTGVLTLSGTSSIANYQTALRSVQFQTTNDAPVTSKTVEFKVNDGDVDSNLATKNIAITPTNDAPTVNTSAGTTAFVEDTSGPVDVDNALTLSDPDSANLSGATVSITTNFESSEDQLVFVDQNGISGAYNSGTGVLTLSGSATVAQYQTALRSVEYNNTDTVAPSTATRTVSFQVTDASSAASNAATKDVSVQSVNDAPVVTPTNGSTPYTEDAPATTIDSGLTVSDQDDTNLEGGQVRISSGFQSGDDLVFINQNGISGVYNSGTGVLTLSGTATVANYQAALRSIQFQSTQQQPVTSKTIEFKVNDGDADSNLPTKEIAVTPTNDAPIVTAGGTTSYTENDPATPIHSGLTVVDGDGDNLSGGSASITANYAAGQDDLNWTDNNLGDNITRDDVNTTDQTIVLTGVDTAANYQAALRAVTYTNTSNNPSTSNRTVTFSATDVPGLTGSDTRTISVTAVDDPPVAVNDSATLLEDAAATSIPVLTNDTDVDGGPKTISSASDPANGTVVLTGGSPGAHTGLTYQPDPNYCNDPPGTTPDTFTYTLNGGSNATVSMTVTCVNDAPVADDETFNGNDSAHGNTTMVVNDPDDGAPTPTTIGSVDHPTQPRTTVSGDILAGDTDIDGPGPMTVTPGTWATNLGGAVALESDGDFAYYPPASTSCAQPSDYFDYTVEDSGSPEQTDTGRVTIALTGCVWYVHNNASGNSGTAQAPFDTLAQAEAASGANHTVFVYDGDNQTTGHDAGGYQMNSGERLLGEHEGLTVDQDHGTANNNFTPDSLHAANPGAHPTFTANGADVIDLDDGNELRGFNVDPGGAGGGIFGGSGDTGGATIDDVNIVDNGTVGQQPGLELNATTGTFNLTNFVVANNATGVLLNNAGTVDLGGDTSQISLSSTGGPALSATGTNMGTSQIDDATVTGSTAGGVILSSASGTIDLGDGTGTDLNLTTTGGSTAALSIANSGTVNVAAAGTDDLHATGGPALDVTGTSGATLAFDDVDSTNSAGDGINLDGLGVGTFSASSGDIGGAAGISFDLNGGSGAITYPGNLNNGSGTTAIDITGRSGGAVTLTGPIADTNDAGGGANIASNTGGSTTLSNGSKQFNTLTGDAVLFNSSDGHTLTLSGGGLDIDTTSGKGLEAVTSGTLEVSGSGNTIDTTTGRGLNVSDTDIASADLTFQRIRTDGAPTGIRLNNTGSAGNLAVTGNGGTCTNANTSGCSGGEIENSTGADSASALPDGTGIVLNNTLAPTFDRMWIHDHTNYGIRGTSVNGFTLTNSVINGTNGNTDTQDDSSVLFWNESGPALTGSANVTDTHIQGGLENNFRVRQTSGTLNRLTFDRVTIGANSTTLGNDGISINGGGTSTMNVTLQNSALTSSRGDLFQMIASSGGDLDMYDNDFSNNHPAIATGGGGVTLQGGLTSGTFSIDVDNDGDGTNTFRDSLTHAIVVEKNIGPGSITGEIDSAQIGLAGTANSGSLEGDGLKVEHEGGGGTLDLDITNNQIRQYNNFGMELKAGDGLAESGTMNLDVTNNTLSNPGAANPGIHQGIVLNSGVTPGDSFTVCLNLKNNVASNSGRNGGHDLRVRQRMNTTVRLPGYSGAPTDTTAVANFLLGQNTAVTASATADSTGFSGAGTVCS